MMGLKSLFRRKKKRKADEEPEIPQETDNTQTESNEENKNPEVPTQLEPSSHDSQPTEEAELPEPQPEIKTEPQPDFVVEETIKDEQQPPQPETPPQVEPLTTTDESTESKIEPEAETEAEKEIKVESPPSSDELKPETSPMPMPTEPAKPIKDKKLSTKLSSIRPWINRRKQKSKQELNKESSLLKYLTFMMTAFAMGLGMTFLPILPQPLPILLAVLVAFLAFRNPRFGMPIGGGIIGLGLIFHLSELHFFSSLGAEEIRVSVVVVWMALFIVLPIIFGRYKSALAVDFGILAFAMLFLNASYFLAIPLILASAVYFRRHVSLSIIYFVLLTVPLQIVQYFEYTVLPLSQIRPDWWVELGSSPPIFTSLSSIFTDINSAVTQFRLYDVSKVFLDITGQMTWDPNYTGINLGNALAQYLDSFPGILLFIVIVGGLAGVLIYFSKLLTSEGGLISLSDKLFLAFTATISSALFFVFLSILQLPLAYTADVSPTVFILAPIATLLITLPVVFIDFTPKQTATTLEVRDKAQRLFERLISLQNSVESVKNTIPINISSPEGKLLVLKDLAQDIVQKCEKHYYDVGEVNQKFVELDKLDQDAEGLEKDVEKILSEYQIYVSGEFSNWQGKFREIGLTIKTPTPTVYNANMTIDERTKAIQDILQQGKTLTQEVIDVAEPIYTTIKELYDPSIPEKNKAIVFAKQRLEQTKAPWVAMQATYNSIHNWNHQYRAEISLSTKYLLESAVIISNLDENSPNLSATFSENLPNLQEYVKTAEKIKLNLESAMNNALPVLNVVSLRNDIQTFLQQTNDVLSLLYSRLVTEEKAIEQSLPVKDYPWSKNISLTSSLKKATETLKIQKKSKTNQIMSNLPVFLSTIDETSRTLTIYRDEKEFLLSQLSQSEESNKLI